MVKIETALKLKDLGFKHEYIPTYQEALSFILELLDAKYNLLYLDLFTDLSGAWKHSEDKETGQEEIEVDFFGWEEMITTGIELLNK
jgi:hypothetical protein